MTSPALFVVLGNQLFDPGHLPPPGDIRIFMCEDIGLCTDVRHHQQKIVLFLGAMRAYADELRAAGYDVTYQKLEPESDRSYEEKLHDAIISMRAQALLHFEIEDKPMERRIVDFAERQQLEHKVLSSPMFLCGRSEFAEFADGRDRLLMADFYRQQRKRLGILVDDANSPAGGHWSFDTENRKKLPARITPPAIRASGKTEHVAAVIELVRNEFPEHPGKADEFWWPTTRVDARKWLDDFLRERLDCFGPYEDAISTRSDTVFHSVLSPHINLGLITPADVVEKTLAHAADNDVPIESLEGFIRQVIGWREFIRGVYRTFSERQEESNFFSARRGLTQAWYDCSTGLPPLDDTIETAQRLGWTHHIPRLMIVGNLMTLCEIHPAVAHRWFMEMYVDSSEWVMGPNVYGMGLFSDGGIFATKPYICGSNYLRKMSDYPKGAWCDIVDGLYWRFISKHRDFFASNSRLALMPRALDRLDAARKEDIFAAAEDFLAAHTVAEADEPA